MMVIQILLYLFYFLITLITILFIYGYYNYQVAINKAKKINIPLIYKKFDLPFSFLFKMFFNMKRDTIQNFVLEYKKLNPNVKWVQTISGGHHVIWVL
jgi:hypothetical protein